MKTTDILKLRFLEDANIFYETCSKVAQTIKQIIDTERVEDTKKRFDKNAFHFYFRENVSDENYTSAYYNYEINQFNIKFHYKNREGEEIEQEYKIRLIQKGTLGTDHKLTKKEIEAIGVVLDKMVIKAQFQLNEITDKPLRDKEDLEKSFDIVTGKRTNLNTHNTSLEKLAKQAVGMDLCGRHGFEQGIEIFLTRIEYMEYMEILDELQLLKT